MPRRKVNIKVTWTFQTDAQFDQVLASISRLIDDPTAYLSLVKGVVRSTLLQAYRKRFLDGVPRMVEMYKETGAAAGKDKVALVNTVAKLELRRAMIEKTYGQWSPQAEAIRLQIQRLAAEYAGGSRFDIGDAVSRAAVAKDGQVSGLTIQHDLRRESISSENIYQGEHDAGEGQLATGLFRRRMNDILDLLTDVQHLVVTTDGQGNLLIGIGDIAALDAITTPSFANPATGGTSKYKIMWRQLEFGTGVYAKPSPRLGPTQYKTGRGTWWFGPSNVRMRRFSGVHLRGSRPANVVRNASGLPYDSDALLFRQAFVTEMQRQVFGG